MSSEAKEHYGVKAGNVSVGVDVRDEGGELRYHMTLPSFEKPTLALMKKIRERLVLEMGAKTMPQGEPGSFNEFKADFQERVGGWIDREVPGLGADIREGMISSIMNKSFGLGDIEYLLKDPSLEEIVVNSYVSTVRVFHRRYGWMQTNLGLESEADVQKYAKAVARETGKELTISNPLLDAYLPNGDRVNVVLFPLSDHGTSMTIRMFARDPWTFTDFVKSGTVTPEILSLLWLMVEYEMNILVSGGTGSGKTSLLNVMMPFIQPNHRVISIEDTRELQLPEFLYWYPMKTRSPNPEGKGEVTMSDLLINALRMRPDRIILGEIRKGVDAEILFEAMNTGHSVYATMHADTSQQTIRRLVNKPLDVSPAMVEAVHLNVVMYRDRRRGIRRILQLAEVIPSENIGGDVSLKTNVLYKWKARNDQITKASEDIRLFQEISLHTGLSKEEILGEMMDKQTIINWLVGRNMRGISDVGRLMRYYYLDGDEVLKAAEEGRDPASLME